MSGYTEGLLALAALNVILAYACYFPIMAGQLNLGAAGFMAVGAYAAAWLGSSQSAGVLACLTGAALAAALAGLVAGVPVLRTRGMYFALATFSLGNIFPALFRNMPALGGSVGLPVMTFVGIWPILACAAGVVLLAIWISASRLGLTFAAIREDEPMAEGMGVNIPRFQAIAFVLGAALAGLGGGLHAQYYNFIAPQNFPVLSGIFFVLYAIVGGSRHALGPLLGALLFTLLPEILRSGAEIRYIISAVVVSVVMILRPEGLMPARVRWRIRPATRPEAAA